MRNRLKELQKRQRGDARLPEDPDRERSAESAHVDQPGVPGWLAKWQEEGKAPVLQFEMLPGETVREALRFAGGLAIQSLVDSLTLRRPGAGGVIDESMFPCPRPTRPRCSGGTPFPLSIAANASPVS